MLSLGIFVFCLFFGLFYSKFVQSLHIDQVSCNNIVLKNFPLVCTLFPWTGLLQLSDQVVQNQQSGGQMTYWDMLNKETSNLVALFNMFQCIICSPVWRFCTTWWLSWKWPIIICRNHRFFLVVSFSDIKYILTWFLHFESHCCQRSSSSSRLFP